MNATKIIRITRYFTLLTFLVGTVFILLIYFSPTNQIVDFSVIYTGVFCLSTLMLFATLVSKAVVHKSSRGKLITTSLLLFLNLCITFVYYLIWTCALDTILIKIINNTGQDISGAGIYGCYKQNWGNLSNGKSKTVRFPGNTDCAFMVIYTLNGNTKTEVLPRLRSTKNIYYLGTHFSHQIEK